jgi:hypothetical protein
MKILLSLLLLAFCSCTNAQKVTGYLTYPEIRKAFGSSGSVTYDINTGIFSAPVNLSAYTNDVHFITTPQAKILFAPVTIQDSVAALNNKIAYLMRRMDSIKATTFIDTTHMYIIVHTIKDSTQLPK